MIGKLQVTSDGPVGPDHKDPTLEATELRAFLAMLSRAGIGFGTRDDHNPPATAVQVEHGTDDDKPWWITDWSFDAAGNLTGVSHYRGEEY